MRYFLRLSYDGTHFHGWQNQPGDISVQQTIEEALSRTLRCPTSIVGAGRTDAGVHAREMFAHFDVDRAVENPQIFLRSLNAQVGNDIALHELIPVAPDAHARFDATERTYRYYVHHRKDPFLNGQSLLIAPLDYEAMNLAAETLLNTDDFSSFAKLHSDAKTNICRVSRARWSEIDHNRHVFTITADRFLRNMVRAVVGTLVDVGRGKLTVDDFIRIIAERNRCSAGTSMPPYALFLEQIRYPYI